MIAVHDLSLRAGNFRLGGVSFTVEAGRYAVLMGRTGSGKTSLLEAICGLRELESGRVVLVDRDVTHLTPADRSVGYVPQDLALFPTMTVRRHLGFALEVRGRPFDEVENRVAELARMLGIAHLLDRYPRGLSGGEAQRVSLGRALAHHPALLLLDEPLGALDEQTRDEMIALLRSVQKATGVTVLHVTHNREEAKKLADHTLVLDNGVVRDDRAGGWPGAPDGAIRKAGP